MRSGSRAAAVLPLLALVGISSGGLTAQSNAGRSLSTPATAAQSGRTAVMTIEGPQGIGVRVGPVPVDAPRFDAASIKLDKSGEMAPTGQGELVHVTAQRLNAPYITTRELIRNAYNLQHVPRSFIVGGPTWIDSERYNVDAVHTQPFGPQVVVNVPPPAAAAMLRSLLADRFHFKAHHEIREMAVYELVLDRADGKLGPGLTPTRAECVGVFELVDLNTINRGANPPVGVLVIDSVERPSEN